MGGGEGGRVGLRGVGKERGGGEKGGDSHHPDDEVDGVDWEVGLAGEEEGGV